MEPHCHLLLKCLALFDAGLDEERCLLFADKNGDVYNVRDLCLSVTSTSASQYLPCFSIHNFEICILCHACHFSIFPDHSPPGDLNVFTLLVASKRKKRNLHLSSHVFAFICQLLLITSMPSVSSVCVCRRQLCYAVCMMNCLSNAAVVCVVCYENHNR